MILVEETFARFGHLRQDALNDALGLFAWVGFGGQRRLVLESPQKLQQPPSLERIAKLSFKRQHRWREPAKRFLQPRAPLFRNGARPFASVLQTFLKRLHLFVKRAVIPEQALTLRGHCLTQL